LGSSQTTTAKADPWKPTRGALKGIVGDASTLYGNGGFKINPYAGDMVADRSGFTGMGSAGIAGAVPGAADANGGAVSALQRIMGQGSTDEMRARVMSDIMPGINASFAGSGMTGSGLHAQNLAKGLSEGMAGMEMGVRGQQMQAAGMMPGATDATMDPYRALMGLGADDEAYRQREIDALMQRDVLGQSANADALKDYAGLMSGIGGNFSAQTQTTRQKMGLGGILGIGLQGLGLF
jgi:hypothetical protein